MLDTSRKAWFSAFFLFVFFFGQHGHQDLGSLQLRNKYITYGWRGLKFDYYGLTFWRFEARVIGFYQGELLLVVKRNLGFVGQIFWFFFFLILERGLAQLNRNSLWWFISHFHERKEKQKRLLFTWFLPLYFIYVLQYFIALAYYGLWVIRMKEKENKISSYMVHVPLLI